jgi:homogentisate 1,2-dioxygenase
MGALQYRGHPATFGACSQANFLTSKTPEDPYRYQVGFGNFFNSEAV